jgi:hypothetical protein
VCTYAQFVSLTLELSLALASLRWDGLQKLELVVFNDNTMLASNTLAHMARLRELTIRGNVEKQPLVLQLPAGITKLQLPQIAEETLQSILGLTRLETLELATFPGTAQDVARIQALPSLQAFSCKASLQSL